MVMMSSWPIKSYCMGNMFVPATNQGGVSKRITVKGKRSESNSEDDIKIVK